MAMSTSASEARYIIESCLTNFRIDGRSQLEYRPYTITNRSTKSNTTTSDTNHSTNAPSLILSNGSSRIHLPGSSTDVLCSVKADLVHPSPTKPNEGVLELNVDLSMCGGGGTVGGVGGAGGGGGGGAQKRRRQQREEESQITSLLQRLVLPHAVDYNKLVVWPGRYVWRLAIDIVVLRCDGCVLDASSIAMREALCNTKLPKVQAVMEGNDSGSSSKNDLMVDGAFKNAVPPAGAMDCPLIVTVSVLSAPPSATSKPGSSKRHRSITIIDARTEEEACASSRVCVSVDPNGMVCGVHTMGGGGVIIEGDEGAANYGGGSSMPLSMLSDVVSSAARASTHLFEMLLNDERTGSMSGRLKDEGYRNMLRDHFLFQ